MPVLAKILSAVQSRNSSASCLLPSTLAGNAYSIALRVAFTNLAKSMRRVTAIHNSPGSRHPTARVGKKKSEAHLISCHEDEPGIPRAEEHGRVARLIPRPPR